jgi:DNA invertase Pin-like site-specific DNA recombinase
MRDLTKLTDDLDQRGVGLEILDMKLDSSTPDGELMINVFGSVAQWKVEIMKSKQRAGIRKAQLEGRYKGRGPTAMQKSDEVMKLLKEGLSAQKVADQLGISRRSVFRIKNAAA